MAKVKVRQAEWMSHTYEALLTYNAEELTGNIDQSLIF